MKALMSVGVCGRRHVWRFAETPYNHAMSKSSPLVAVVMGSISDWETMRYSVELLDELAVLTNIRSFLRIAA